MSSIASPAAVSLTEIAGQTQRNWDSKINRIRSHATKSGVPQGEKNFPYEAGTDEVPYNGRPAIEDPVHGLPPFEGELCAKLLLPTDLSAVDEEEQVRLATARHC